MSDNFEYTKCKLLERFKLSPEYFGLEFVPHQAQSNESWKDFPLKLSNYFKAWLEGTRVADFD